MDLNKIIVLICLVFSCNTSFCQMGALDGSFDFDGKVITDFASDEDICFSMSIQPDLKIVAGGETYQNGKWHFSLARYFSGLNVGIIKLPDSNSSFLFNPILSGIF